MDPFETIKMQNSGRITTQAIFALVPKQNESYGSNALQMSSRMALETGHIDIKKGENV